MNEAIDPTEGTPVIEWANALVPVVKSAIPRNGVGVLVRRKGAGFSIEVPPKTQRPVSHSFMVHRKSWATSSGGLSSVTYRVSEGRIFLSEDWDDLAEVTDLTDTDCELSADSDSIWLELHQVGDSAPTISLQHGAVWEDFPAMWKYVAPESETAEPSFYWYQRLAFLRPPRAGEAAMKIGGVELVLEQVVKTDLIRRSVCVESVTGYKVPQLWPWH